MLYNKIIVMLCEHVMERAINTQCHDNNMAIESHYNMVQYKKHFESTNLRNT